MAYHLLTRITAEKVSKWRKEFFSDAKNLMAMNICDRIDPYDACITRRTVELSSSFFNYKADEEVKPKTNQKGAGRCWIYATLNCLRLAFVKAFNLEEFDFSPAHLFYWDKVERCNFFLMSVVNVTKRGEKLDDRLMAFLLKNPVSDGGQWDMCVNLITKYGIMPKSCFPETFSFDCSDNLNSTLRSKLREYAKVLRELLQNNASDEAVHEKIEDMMGEVYKVIGICLGIPPETFVWEYYDQSKSYHTIGPITPLEFYNNYVKPHFNLEDKMCFVNDERSTSSYNQLYTVDCQGNMVDGRPVLYNNQPMQVLIDLAIESLKHGEPVWSGCELSKPFARKLDIDDIQKHDFKLMFDVEIQTPLTKADRMIFRESNMTYTMVFTGVFIGPVANAKKFRVENCWGDDNNTKSHLLMPAEWFKEFGKLVVIDKKFLKPEILEVYKMEPIVLPIWDPLGCLAGYATNE